MKKILAVPFKVKEVDEAGVFSGYGSVFGNVDQGRDMVIGGAFKNTLAKHALNNTMPLMFYSHLVRKELGEWLEMAEDEHGLWCKGRLWIDGPHPDPDAMKAYRGMKKDKGKMGLSIGYDLPEGGAEYVKEGAFWKLKEIDLWEVSPTPFPMNELARIESVKAVEGIRTKRDFEKFLREQGFTRTAAASIASAGYREQGDLARTEAEKEIESLLTKNIQVLGG